MTSTDSAKASLASIAVRWILANVLPQLFLLVASLVYLNVHEITAAELIVVVKLTRLPDPVWLTIAAVYVVMMVWARGAVVRPLVPRFSIPGWVAAAVVTSLAVLTVTTSGSLLAVVVAKGLAASGRPPTPPPTGLPMPALIFGGILGAEIIGAILGALPGVVIGAIEALVVGRSTRNTGTWVLWTTAAWSMIFALALVPAFVVVLYPRLPPGLLTGIAAALGTLPAVARLSRGGRERPVSALALRATRSWPAD